MTLVNHAAAGAIIALTINKPILSLPLAFISHYALDALPHFGYGRGGFGEAFKHKLTQVYIAFDLIAMPFLIWSLIGTSWVIWAAAFIATIPDLMWPYVYFGFEKKNLTPPGGPLTEFHSWIQWCHRPWGLIVEIILAVILIAMVWVIK